MKKALGFLFAAVSSFSFPAHGASDWTIHEWGTFTSLQDEAGKTIGGINTDDEPVPHFVHRLAHGLLQNPSEMPVFFFQGAPKCHPDVTMRLETPVIYFHPPDTAKDIPKSIHKASVNVKFRGGWLTEFYPQADPEVAGFEKPGDFKFDSLNSDSMSRLEWSNLKIGGDWPLTNTTEHVWTSPRAVNAALVQTTTGESEKFLFYRGVAHLDAPLRISRENGQLILRSQLRVLPADRPLKVDSSWLVDIRPNGTLAFRPLPAFTLDQDDHKIIARTAAKFAENDFSPANLDKLKGGLRKTLISEGLFADEADALLNTWELSYFKSAGLRLFFIVPPAWTDHYLPLEISLPAQINRVMVGRIEIVTPDQRARLKEIAAFTPAKIEEEAKTLALDHSRRLGEALTTRNGPSGADERELHSQVSRGQKPLSAFTPVPNTYQTYLDLGRFRNALILDHAKRAPSPALASFIQTYHLESGVPTRLPEPP